ncbi:hypothetical protein MJO28_003721 [Puccinia striiformis f. sp. tritici]|uniref:Uncharacterized protein n=3 Tax=Puccinia striiformis TaxID=27350 RepID=A0A0L0US74_9BASI|nr:hypothetical protein Pst134EA_007669 [Puccinia striiformis f. sp. tritici]KAI9610990.1 hypothetical protein H4Q26_008837 [Puccinia striiformis f. sp. tritici PST-130]KNE89761.1 hypothetical protein PSTG_16794 [Puccinia striiformis f. sp. tritici PST-78]POW10812.1 hypothetical protein PSTT_05809 [Puccinia striiformis]KAH9460595.1 hypothetical protein Pst134EB_008760 [Puccinia striiformis f. sp. tritici]KAH9470411.1 hypothetical protein Pst134EA_007669 [Puccinia striiformis f. sp. tritici]
MTTTTSRTSVTPGQELITSGEAQPSATYQCGPGTFERQGKVYASVVGQPTKNGGTISVSCPSRCAKVPVVGTNVIGMITKVTKQQAHMSIMMVDDLPIPIGQEFQGVIRSQDVRQVDKDKVIIWDCYRPGDIVRAEVISLPTSAMGYLLATFRNHLGVLFAEHSLTGNRMTAISWKEMKDIQTGQKEARKVAGPN